jgi:hypothetical protein
MRLGFSEQSSRLSCCAGEMLHGMIAALAASVCRDDAEDSNGDDPVQ